VKPPVLEPISIATIPEQSKLKCVIALLSLCPPLETHCLSFFFKVKLQSISTLVPGLSILFVSMNTLPESINPIASCLLLTRFLSKSNLSILILFIF
tara:strand:- start:1113 stop:1403 length:291 start_codon:yes stop_codon:yes gene_type:complete